MNTYVHVYLSVLWLLKITIVAFVIRVTNAYMTAIFTSVTTFVRVTNITTDFLVTMVTTVPMFIFATVVTKISTVMQMHQTCFILLTFPICTLC